MNRGAKLDRDEPAGDDGASCARDHAEIAAITMALVTMPLVAGLVMLAVPAHPHFHRCLGIGHRHDRGQGHHHEAEQQSGNPETGKDQAAKHAQ
jgi:hypothetical protein